MKTVITCEHASADIPDAYLNLFLSSSAQKALTTHRGCDIGARNVAELLSGKADFYLIGTASRLLIDLNRSLNNKNLFSEWSGALSEFEKSALINEYYLPYRNKIEKKIANWIGRGEKVRHLSIHSFTPKLNGEVRLAEIGLLYDSTRKSERAMAHQYKEGLKGLLPDWRIRSNYPYLGKSDGLTTYLRKKFPKNYFGIEIEINQKLFLNISAKEIADYLKAII